MGLGSVIFELAIIPVYIILAVLTIIAMNNGNGRRYIILKTITSFLFLIIGLVTHLLSEMNVYLYFLPTYLLCFTGDVFLALANETEGKMNKKNFYIGLGSFFLAHVNLIVVIIILCGLNVFFIAIEYALIMCLATIISSRTKFFRYNGTVIPCVAYAALIGFVGGLGLTLIAVGGTPHVTLIGVGCFMFMISDAIIGFKYFSVFPPFVKHIMGAFELSIYYIAILFLSVFPALFYVL